MFFSLRVFSSNQYHVEVETDRGNVIFTVAAATDSVALDSVYIGVIYNKRLGKVISANVIESGLSTKDLPQRVFQITTEKKAYSMILNVANPIYAMTAIQASKYLMSNTTARDIRVKFETVTLKSKLAKKYVVKYTSKEVPYLLNVNSLEEGLTALDIAARIYQTRYPRDIYERTYVPNVKVCSAVFGF